MGNKKKRKIIKSWSEICVHDKLPKRKENLLTNKFLLDFKSEIERIFKQENMTYWDIVHLEGTGGFGDAFRFACKKHNLMKAIYKFYYRSWYDGDFIDGELTTLLKTRGLVKYTSYDEWDDESELLKDPDIYFYNIVKKHKGYNVITRD